MGFKIQKEDKYAVLYTQTEKIQSINAPLLKSELVMLIKGGFKNIIVDMADTRYCDSSGLSALLTGNRLSKEAEGTFVLSSLQPSVEKLIAISQLNSVFDIVPTKDEAIDVVLMEEIERELKAQAGDKS
ncbi:STAS domain-containing protein [Cryomorphaceae bacterium 1068]|nr:STAS domain-containing protein [Cryomorphaceae bacterium 1068]